MQLLRNLTAGNVIVDLPKASAIVNNSNILEINVVIKEYSIIICSNDLRRTPNLFL